MYGAAANPSGHGHNYVLEVTLEGEPDPVTGMVFDLKKLKELIQQTVIDPMDHRFFNYEVPPFRQDGADHGKRRRRDLAPARAAF